MRWGWCAEAESVPAQGHVDLVAVARGSARRRTPADGPPAHETRRKTRSGVLTGASRRRAVARRPPRPTGSARRCRWRVRRRRRTARRASRPGRRRSRSGSGARGYHPFSSAIGWPSARRTRSIRQAARSAPRSSARATSAGGSSSSIWSSRVEGVSPRRRMSWLNDARCSRLSSRGVATNVPFPWMRCSSPSAIRLSIALRTVARETSYVAISSRSEGIAASGPSSRTARSASTSLSCACLGRGPSVITRPGALLGQRGPLDGRKSRLVRSGTYQLRMIVAPRRLSRPAGDPMSTHPVTQMAREVAEQPEAVRRTLDALLPRREPRPRARPRVAGTCCSRRAAPATTRGLRPLPARDPCRRGRRAGVAERRDALPRAPRPRRHARGLRLAVGGDRGDRRRPRRGRARAAPRRWPSPTSRAPPLAEAATWRWSPRPAPSSRCRRRRPTSPSWSRWPCSAPRSRPTPTALDDDLDRVPGEVERLLTAGTGVDAAVAALRDAAYAVVSGRGLMMGTALETALKLEETCLRPVRGYSYADLRHGPISVVTSGMTARAGGRGRRADARSPWSSWPATSPGAAPPSSGSAGTRRSRPPARRTCPARTCPRPSPRSARSSRRS